MFGIRFASVVVVCGFCLVLAGCGPDDDPLDPPKTSIDTTTSSSTSTSSTSSTIFEGITSPGVPAEFRFTVEGWTYEVSVDRIGRLTAEATVDPNSPPNIGKPANKMVFDNLREEVWEWHIEGMPHNELTWFNVYFDTGSGLVKKAGKRVEIRG